MWNEEQASLVPREAAGYADDAAMLGISYRQGEALPGKVFASGKPQRADEIDFRRDFLLKAEALGLYRQATGGRLPVSSLLLPILVEGGPSACWCSTTSTRPRHSAGKTKRWRSRWLNRLRSHLKTCA